jgi:Radical SAM superfamily
MPERRHPDWIKVRAPASPEFFRTRTTLGEMRLHTVCQEACCPNIGECFSHRTATFMLMGDVCTRNCPYCAVAHGKVRPLDPDEPRRIAEAVNKLGLRHIVVTSVDRDDLPDGGAAHFAATARAIKQTVPESRVEVLVPGQFAGRYLQPQHRDGAEPLPHRASRRALRPLPRRAAPCKGDRPRTRPRFTDQGGRDAGVGRGARRACNGSSRSTSGRVRHFDAWAVSAPLERSSAGRALRAAGGVRRTPRRGAGARLPPRGIGTAGAKLVSRLGTRGLIAGAPRHAANPHKRKRAAGDVPRGALLTDLSTRYLLSSLVSCVRVCR